MTKNLVKGDLIPFSITQNLVYIKKLGFGGTGDTHLFFDKTAEKYFAIKKYVPKENNDIDECYKRFVDEIKILLDINHANIVRVYNYYLYPQYKTGYIQMEYIEGDSINTIDCSNVDALNKIFMDTIDAFVYLESKGILHRDIRPSNLLITKNNDIKIIDFGFGKKITAKHSENSVLLNWPATHEPEEIEKYGQYNFATEIYYLGHIFKNLYKCSPEQPYSAVVDKMCEIALNRRFNSFLDIKRQINETLFFKIDFNMRDKQIYRKFADCLMASLVQYNEKPQYILDLDKILQNIENIILKNSLEETIQGNDQLISCFVSSAYTYKPHTEISVEIVERFYKFIQNIDSDKKGIVIQNLLNRLQTIETMPQDDMPF